MKIFIKTGREGGNQTIIPALGGHKKEAFISLAIISTFNHLYSYEIKKEKFDQGSRKAQKCLLGLSQPVTCLNETAFHHQTEMHF